LTCLSEQGYVRLVAGFFEEAPDSIASRVASGLSQLGLVIKSQAWAGASERGLTPTQGQILTLLRSHAESSLRLSQVASSLGISPPTASDSVRTLVRKGLVQKARAEGDARAIALELTRRGQAEAECAAAWPDFLVSAISTLSECEQEAFLIALIKMIGALVERGRVPTQRMCVSCRHFQPRVGNEQKPHYCSLAEASLATRELRLDCVAHSPVGPEQVRRNLAVFAS
jgi:DNA-binding MarR family transcriptional regulator